MSADERASRFPRGNRLTMARLSADPYPILADLRAHEPVSWVPETEMWFVTRYDDVRAVLADFETYTVDTEQSIIRDMFGRHMMTLDGPQQVRHKKQCMPMFSPRDLAASVGSSLDERVARLIDELAGGGGGELRSQLARPPRGRDGHPDPRAAAGPGSANRLLVRPLCRGTRQLCA